MMAKCLIYFLQKIFLHLFNYLYTFICKTNQWVQWDIR
jgi:hypothetical protein